MSTAAEIEDIELERLPVFTLVETPEYEEGSGEPDLFEVHRAIRERIHETGDLTEVDPGYYLAAWQDLLRTNHGLNGSPYILEAIHATERRLVRLDGILANQQTGRSYATEAADWYHSLGSLNNMVGAEEALLQAGTAMEKTADSVHGRPIHRVWAGNMYHEAALLMPLEIRPWLFAAALDQYQAAAESKTGPIVYREIAERYRYDLLFQALSDLANAEAEGHSGKWSEEHKQRFRELLADQADGLITILERDYARYQVEHHKLDSLRGKKHEAQRKAVAGAAGTVAGKAYEWFVLLGTRYWQVRRDRYGDRMVRSSFSREQDVRLHYRGVGLDTEGKPFKTPKTKPKHSVDIVVERRRRDGRTSTEHWQSKTQRATSRYLDNILPIEAGVSWSRDELPYKEKRFVYDDFDRFVAFMGEAARIFARHCRGEDITKDEVHLASAALKYVRPPRAA